MQSIDIDVIMSLSNEEIQQIQQMTKQKYVEKHHKRKISYHESKNLWRTWVGPDRKEITKRKKQDLIDYLYDYYRKIEKGDNLTIKEVARQLRDYKQNNLNRSLDTIRKDKSVFDRFSTDEFADKFIDEFTEDYLEEYINFISKKIHPKKKALREAITLFKKIFDYAQKKHLIDSNPMDAIDINNYFQNCDLSSKTSDEKIFSQNEITKIKGEILSRLDKKGYNPYLYAILFAIETGVRCGEIPPLTWEDVNEEGIHIYKQQRIEQTSEGYNLIELLFTKNERQNPKNGRWFPLTEELAHLFKKIEQQQRELHIESKYIFAKKNGDWINKHSYLCILRRICKKMGYTITNNHALRMSLNSNVFIESGLPVTIRSYLLGHSVEINERYYSHTKSDILSDVKNKIEGNSPQFPQNSQSNIISFNEKRNKKVLAKDIL